MPQEYIYQFRQWCKQCKDFTLHKRIYKDEERYIDFGHEFNSVCKCDTVYTPIEISEIPKEKLIAQRTKFREQRKKDLVDTYNIFSMLGYGSSNSMFGGVSGPVHRIVESDAGLVEEERIEKENRRQEKIRIQQNLQRFHHLGRNDICICGTGKKYKNCCLKENKQYIDAGY